MLTPDLIARARNPNTRQTAIIEFADFARNLILFFDGELETAARIGYEITVGLERDLAEAGKHPGGQVQP